MKKVILSVTGFFLFISCNKERETIIQLKNGEAFDCEYIITGVPAPIFDLLENPDDPEEEILDEYLYYIAKALSIFACEEDIQSVYESLAFSRYENADADPDLDTEVEITDLIEESSDFYAILTSVLQANGINAWEDIEHEFTWKEIEYTPIIYLENGAVADWNYAPYFGIGTDVEDDEITEYIPAFYNDCSSGIEELLIGKVDPQAVAATDPGPYDADCIQNPLLIVQLGWSKNKKSIDLGDPNEFEGSQKDTILPDPPGPGCDSALHFHIIKGNLGGQRYERSKYSEYNLEKLTIPIGNSSLSYYPYDSRREHLRKIHKNDRNKNFFFNHEFLTSTGNPPIPIGPIGLAPGHRVYSTTYEFDWYAKNRNISFDTYRGIKPYLRMKRKGDHEHYQIMCITDPTPPEWCDKEVREYTIKTGQSEVMASN